MARAWMARKLSPLQPIRQRHALILSDGPTTRAGAIRETNCAVRRRDRRCWGCHGVIMGLSWGCHGVVRRRCPNPVGGTIDVDRLAICGPAGAARAGQTVRQRSTKAGSAAGKASRMGPGKVGPITASSGAGGGLCRWPPARSRLMQPEIAREVRAGLGRLAAT